MELGILWSIALCSLASLIFRATSTKLSPEPGGLCTSSVYRCDIRSEARRLTCAGTLHGVHAFPNELHNRIRFLSLCKWYQNYFNPELLRLYNKIEKFTLSRSIITRLVYDFPPLHKLKVIIMANLDLEDLSTTTFHNVRHLRVLDIRGKEYMCKDELLWIADDSRPGNLILDRHEMVCGWKYPGLGVEPVMRILKKMNAECPSDPPYHCMCMLDNAVENLPPESLENSETLPSQELPPLTEDTGRSSGNLVPIITVDCSYRKLNRLPDKLPDNTTTVLAQGNQITDISLLLTNQHYSHILDLILDYNPIKSIDRLEGAVWLQTFRNLSLRGNKLTQLPTYALDNALERNPNVNHIYLGDNPWKCDCRFTPGFQDLMVKYESVIPDPMNIRCAVNEDPAISQQPIRTLSKSLICSSDQSNIQPLLLLNIGLLTSIMFVLLKFCYDYIMYKKFGQLPWIITIIP
ncbi:hypothetical protein M8J75_014148 [Diaphorina citri]|nr:hypothetical protein M8J75_014148 [Diaphorina citri]